LLFVANLGKRKGISPIFGLFTPAKACLDIFWLRDESPEESDLPDPDVHAQEIVEDLEVAPRTIPLARCFT
jgi:hypothetical protein